jgi:S-DNA-T family DNA segregation ATPase FtsK/SpoIIIE
VRFLTPTENKRLNELIGFLCITLAILMALSMLSYSPKDASFNVSAPPPENHPARNWIGPFGAYLADALFSVFGFAAFLMPAAVLVLGWRWFRSRAIDSPVATLIGLGLLLLSLPTLLALWGVWNVRGAIPAGGFVGELIAGGLRTGFNQWGANLVAFAFLVTAIFMTTRFSFSGAHAWANGPHGPIGAVERLGILQKAQARVQVSPMIIMVA